MLQAGLTTSWTSPKWLACVVVEESARASPDGSRIGLILRASIATLVEAPISPDALFLELVPFLQTLRRKCQALANAFVEHGKLASNKLPILPVLVQGEPDAGPQAFAVQRALDFVEKDYDKLNNALSAIYRSKASKLLKESRDSLAESIDDFRFRKEVLERRIVSAAASSILWVGDLGNKLNPIIQGIMNAVKVCCFLIVLTLQMEDNEFLQRRSASAIARLIALCVEQGRTKVSDKLIRNLSAFLCVDTTETPEFHPHQTLEQSILSLKREEEKKDPKDLVAFAKTAAEAKIKRNGAQAALEELSDTFGASLFSSVPRLKECMSAFTIKGFTDGFPEDIKSDSSTFGQSIIDEFSILRTLLPRLNFTVIEQLQKMYPYIVNAIECRFSVIRFAAARCFASMCKANLSSGMKYMVENILPMIADQHELRRRQGAVECIYRTCPTSNV